MTRAEGGAPIVLTLGEPAGIGPDIALETWRLRSERPVPPFIIAGDPQVFRRRAAALGWSGLAIRVVEPEDAGEAFGDSLPFLPDMPEAAGDPGVLSAGDAQAVIASIRAAAASVQRGRASAIVTSPINKKALNAEGFPFPGHTEFLAELAASLFGIASEPVMMLAGPDLRVVPVTVHIPLVAVPAALTTDLIRRTGATVARELTSRFGVASPRLALSGLNPHAGEEGMLGHEDAAIIAPAVAALRAAGIDAIGPLPADTMFHAAMRSTYDAALCMYHDQALIPLKTLAFDEGVNVTLGLPFIRTSPDHGTALPLAGTGKARPESLIAALRMAADLARRAALV